ncbi:hypothetical protein ACH4Y0_33065 [Streptomyces sp. NPDC020707]|uniref:hypothetical protein n=1 Tax=Streptomyces sp. NPDC020707 TaxID=3365084 RepID=UPI0037B34033
MNTLRRRLGVVVHDVRRGRHIEAYALFLLGLLLVGLGQFDVVGSRRLLQFTVAGLAFLVFRTAVPSQSVPASADDVLHQREDLGPLRTLLENARDLRVYGPTAINVLAGADDLKRVILQRGGTVRFVVLDPSREAVADAAVQLDDNLDLELALRGSLRTLRRLEDMAGFEFRRLPFNPGFSLLIVNGDSLDGTLVVEFHGFGDHTIKERMHVVLTRRTSPHWYDYWLCRFEAVWEASLPGSTGSTSDDADPEATPR